MEALGNTLLIVVVTAQILLYFWFITFGLLGSCIYFYSVRERAPKTAFVNFWMFVPFWLTIAIVIAGGVWRAEPTEDKYYPWAADAIYTLLLLHFPIFGMTIWKAEGRRKFIGALSGFQLWLSLSSGFVSLMSVKDEWL